MIACFYKLQRGIDRRHSRGKRKPESCILERRDVLLKRRTGRVLSPCILVTLMLAEAVLGISRGLIDRNADRPGRRVRLVAGVYRSRRKTRSEERRVGKECRSRWSP